MSQSPPVTGWVDSNGQPTGYRTPPAGQRPTAAAPTAGDSSGSRGTNGHRPGWAASQENPAEYAEGQHGLLLRPVPPPLPGSPGYARVRREYERRWLRSVLVLWTLLGTLLVLVGVNALRQQVVLQQPIRQAAVVLPPSEDDIERLGEAAQPRPVQDPRRVVARLTQARGSIYARGLLVAASEHISGTNYTHRIYPVPDIAYIVGHNSATSHGNAGLEQSFNAQLTGEWRQDAWRRFTQEHLDQPIQGDDLHITIDPEIQAAAERLIASSGFRGSLVVLDPRDGAVLAMVSYPHYDPQELSFNPAASDWKAEGQRIAAYMADLIKRDQGELYNRATMGEYTPGSTMKTLTTVAALKSGMDTSTVFTDTDGTVVLPGGGMTHRDCLDCHPYLAPGPMYTLSEGYKWSLNVVFARLAVLLGPSGMDETARAMGFYHDVSDTLGLPVKPARLYPVDGYGEYAASVDSVGMSGYGQGKVTANTLYMALAAACVANDGRCMSPYLVRAVTHHATGEVLWTFDPRVLSEAMASPQARRMQEIMATSVMEGWASEAAIPWAWVGGKTGTAETGNGQFHSWYMGWASPYPLAGSGPMHQGEQEGPPTLAVAVMLENGGEGQAVALPIAREISVIALAEQARQEYATAPIPQWTPQPDLYVEPEPTRTQTPTPAPTATPTTAPPQSRLASMPPGR
jgi:penicillin-binding protein A